MIEGEGERARERASERRRQREKGSQPGACVTGRGCGRGCETTSSCSGRASERQSARPKKNRERERVRETTGYEPCRRQVTNRKSEKEREGLATWSLRHGPRFRPSERDDFILLLRSSFMLPPCATGCRPERQTAGYAL